MELYLTTNQTQRGLILDHICITYNLKIITKASYSHAAR